MSNSTISLDKVNPVRRKKKGKENKFELDGFKFKVGTVDYYTDKQCVYINAGGWCCVRDVSYDLKKEIEAFRRQFKVWSYKCIPTLLKGVVNADFMIRDISFNDSNYKTTRTTNSYIGVDITFFLLGDAKYLDYMDKIELICEDIKDMMVENQTIKIIANKKAT